MTKIPYGISHFGTLITDGYLYIDKTAYVQQLEEMSQRYLFFLRPRRFGKSLFISLLEHYYGIEHKANFQTLFGNYYIGQHPTRLANSYLTLVFDFSQMDTSSFENTFDAFLENVKDGVERFFTKYNDIFNQEDINGIEKYDYPAKVIQYLFRKVEAKARSQKIYLLIDEYDHFANEILAFHFNDFNRMVGQNGFVRKFFEAIKTATRNGVVDRIFVTGVSPITLDSLTSGFNISTNISLYERFNAMMGFTEAEVNKILDIIKIPDNELVKVKKDLKAWYDGYVFNTKMTERIYNSDMVLYFTSYYNDDRYPPEELLDPNIASDFTKIRRLFKIKGKEKAHLAHLNKLLETGTLTAKLIRQFDLERRFGSHDFVSLLYYMGILTIVKEDLEDLIFRMPNYVIEQLYYQYFHQIILEQSELSGSEIDVQQKIKTLAQQNDIRPLVAYTEAILTELSNRDKMRFDEKYVKVIFTSAFYTSGIYTIHNEKEVKKSATEKGYVDILLIRRPPYKPTYQFVIEFKYVKKSDTARTTAVKAGAIEQLQAYLENDAYLQELVKGGDLKAYVVVFVGNVGEIVEVDLLSISV